MDPAANVRASVRWAGSAVVLRQGVQLATLAVVARLLDPSDFGLMAMALVVIGITTLVRDIGVAPSIIERETISRPEIAGQNALVVLLGVAAGLVVFVTAPLVGDLFRDGDLTAVLRVLALTFPLAAVGIVPQAVLERTMAFRSVAQIEAVAAVAGGAVAITLAFSQAGVWALVGQAITSTLVASTLLFLATRSVGRSGGEDLRVGRPSTFGLQVAGYNVSNFVVRNADYFLVGRYLGSDQLGLYAVPYRLMLIPVQLVSAPFNRVLFPALARRRRDPAGFRTTYLEAITSIGILAMPVALGLAATAPSAIPALLGAGWEDSIPALQLLALVGLAQTIGATVGPVFLALGRGRALLWYGIASAAAAVAGFAVGLAWGIVGVSAAYAAVSIGLLVPSMLLAYRPIELPISQVARALARPATSGILMAIAVVIADRSLTPVLPPVMRLVIDVAVGGVAYGLLSNLLCPRSSRQAFAIVLGERLAARLVPLRGPDL